jgi:type II secretion system protein N
VKDKLLRGLKWAVYPAFYFFCLLVFGYLTFPFDRLKERLLSEIAKQSKGKGAPVVTIEKLDSYWLSGVQVSGTRITFAADDSSSKAGFGSMGGGFGMGAVKSEPAKDSTIEIKEAHARARLLPLIIGRVQLDFWASVFGGEVQGTAPAGASKGDDEVKLSEIEPLQNLLGIPIDGKVSGALSLTPTDGKFSKASGKLDFSIKNIVVSDGKTKIQGLLAIPPAKVDEIAIAGEADKGVLKITKLSAGGPDLELDGDGKINVRDPWGESSVDLYIKFRFTDAYRGKDATTKSILGEPGSTAPPLIELQVSKLKKAKRADGFYGFHIHGKLKKLEFTPSSTEVSGSGSSGTSGSGSSGGSNRVKGGGRAPELGSGSTSTGKRLGGIALPLGTSTAVSNPEKEKEPEPEEKKEDKPPEDRKLAAPLALPFPVGGAALPEKPAPAPADSDPPVFAPPPPQQPENPGGGEEKPEEKPVEEPR